MAHFQARRRRRATQAPTSRPRLPSNAPELAGPVLPGTWQPQPPEPKGLLGSLPMIGLLPPLVGGLMKSPKAVMKSRAVAFALEAQQHWQGAFVEQRLEAARLVAGDPPLTKVRNFKSTSCGLSS